MDEDAVLVARLVAGDDDAVAELFDRYAPYVLGLARRVTQDASGAEDVAQDVFVAFWTDPTRFDPDRGTLRSYLGVHAYRRAVDAVRRDTRRRAREEREATIDLTGSNRQCDAIDAATVGEVVKQAIHRLPADQREALELAFWHGHTYREVAEILAIPEGTAKSRLRLAQAKLSEWLAPLDEEPA